MKKQLLAITVLVTILAIASLSSPISAKISTNRKTLIDLHVPYHPQDKHGYCGAAVAQMWIDYITGEVIDQGKLLDGDEERDWDGIYNHNPGQGRRGTSPKALAEAVSHYLSYYGKLSDPATIEDYSYDNPYLAVFYQAISIIFWQQPSAAVVWQGEHWMLVEGVVLQQSGNGKWIIKGFYVHDPYPFRESCGFPGPTAFKTVKAWVNSYFTPIAGTGLWSGKWVTVEYYPWGTHPAELYQVSNYKVEIKSWGGEPATIEDVVKEAKRGLRENGLYDSESFGSSLKGAKAASPIRVRSLSENLNDYYIVPFEKKGKISAVAIVDAVTGDFLEAACGPAIATDYLTISSTQAEEIIHEYTGKEVTQPPELVWMPCSHSWQPYYPFWLGVTVDGDQICVDMNGNVFEP